jgi:uncharacterized protein
MSLSKEDWILLALKQTPLDRIHIMKALFLIWHRSSGRIENYFEFTPYLYGPCSFEVYSVLENLRSDRLIVQPPHPKPQWVNYYLTEKGIEKSEEAAKKIPLDLLEFIRGIANEVSPLSFYELLKKVYKEAPEFAAKSMFRGVTE